MASYEVLTDPAQIPWDLVHSALVRLYACEAPSLAVFLKAAKGSLHFVALDGRGGLAGYARVVTDGATFGRVLDVFVDEHHRGRGVAELLMDAVFAAPEVAGVPLFASATSGRGFFEQSGRQLESSSQLQLR